MRLESDPPDIGGFAGSSRPAGFAVTASPKRSIRRSAQANVILDPCVSYGSEAVLKQNVGFCFKPRLRWTGGQRNPLSFALYSCPWLALATGPLLALPARPALRSVGILGARHRRSGAVTAFAPSDCTKRPCRLANTAPAPPPILDPPCPLVFLKKSAIMFACQPGNMQT